MEGKGAASRTVLKRSRAESVEAPSSHVVGKGAKEQFLAWAAAKSIEIHPSVDLFHDFRSNYRGCIARQAVQRGEVVIRIKRSDCIGPSTEDASRAEWTKAMESAGVRGVTGQAWDGTAAAAAAAASSASAGASSVQSPRLTKACFTVLRLLHELGLEEKSSFAPYLAMLPVNHRIPIQWTSDELALLKGTSAEGLVAASSLDHQFKIFEELLKLHPSLWAPKVCTREAFARAVNWVRSRGFTVFGEPYMVPCADMANHDPEHQNVHFQPDGEDHFAMVALQPIAAGQELLSSFGRLPNAHLVNSYGFVLRNNPFDTVLVPTQIVVDVCKQLFVGATESAAASQGKAAAAAEAGQAQAQWDGVWAQRMAMARGQGLLPPEGFTVSKYDLMPDDLASLLQVLTMSEAPEVVYGAMLEVVNVKMKMYAVKGDDSATAPDGVGADAFAVARALVREECGVLRDLRAQLLTELMEEGVEEPEGAVNGEEGEEEEAGSAAMAAAMASRNQGRAAGSASKGKRKR